MSNPNYTLEIISHHPEFKNRNLKKYYVDGIETIGAWGNEPFEIRFKNNTWQKVQVKLSVDGTDVLSGDLANTDVSKDMWVVNGYGTLNLKAWPETHNGGAQFIFASAEKSVAVHTHGDLSNRGIIAAAVFVEGHVEPIKTAPIIINNHYPRHYLGDYWVGGYYGSSGSLGGFTNNGGTYSSNSISTSSVGGATMDSMDVSFNDSRAESLSCNNAGTIEKQSLVAVGAGQHVDQKISYVTGLIKPQFSESVRVRYLWWDDLHQKLRESNVPTPHASGFPGDNHKGINLGNTPRIGSYTGSAFPRTGSAPIQPVYSRV